MRYLEELVPEKQWEIKDNETSRAIALQEQWEVKISSKNTDMVFKVASFCIVGFPFSEPWGF